MIIRNIPEQKYFSDIKHVTVTADSPDLSDFVTELAYSMLKSFTPHMSLTIEEENILVCISGYKGGGPRVVVSTAAFQARVRDSVPGLDGLKETKNVSSPSTCESQYCGEPP